ncbi:TraR/DksA family transcriptional regulator [Actinomadura hibisca]|uniref:TraR/DksA family transcriptional regulator n=1 Tax=Actinomadura hibisca TaxID=68565 RepID=UPI0009FDF627|nr:TraR/DksA C4-type zinc finger protein [Actinomadura hibisca]
MKASGAARRTAGVDRPGGPGPDGVPPGGAPRARERLERRRHLLTVRLIIAEGAADAAALARYAGLRRAVADNEAALSRLAAGTYGLCADCAEPILPDRLEIMPEARRCVPCELRRPSPAAARR